MTKTVLQTVKRRGFCLILSSPMGAGKTTLARLLVSSDEHLTLSVSATTRPRRVTENDGVDYFFLSIEEFASLKDANGFLEWAEVFGNFYGTPATHVETTLASGRDLVFDIDWQGAQSIALLMPEDAVRVFVLPPSRAEMIKRIHGRGTDTPEVIARRLAGADEEMTHWQDYDYIIVNDDLQESLKTLKIIVAAERLKRHRATWQNFIISLMSNGDTASS